MKAGNKILEMHKYCKTNLKKIKNEEDRKAIEEITQTKIFQSITVKELAIIMRVYRGLAHSKPGDDD